jgi:hypothetical protein
MSGPPKDFDEAARLISALLDGRLTGVERTRLALLLERDPAIRRLYFQMMDQEIELQTMAAPAADSEISPLSAGFEGRSANRRQHWRQWWLLGLLTAGAAAAVALLWPRTPPPEGNPDPVASTAASAVWSADFENGIPQGWFGTPVTTGLPPGSTEGIAAAKRSYPYGTFWVIEAPESWNEGFAPLTSHSTLHITYRLVGSGAALSVFLHTLSNPLVANPEPYAMHRLAGSQFPGAAGGWRTASIPLSLFVKKVPDPSGELKFSGGPPAPGDKAASLAFSSPQPVDLVIDSIWITPDGTGTEVIQPLP